jgi:hypothetical protein
MKDYFDALAARIIQPERGVQPRPRAPFEDGGALAPGASEGSSAPMSPARTRSRAASPAEHHYDSHTRAQRAETAGDELRAAHASARGNPRRRALESPLESGNTGREQPSEAGHTARIHDAVRIETSTSPAVDRRPVSSSERTARGTGLIAPGSIAPRIVAPRATAVAAHPPPRVAGASDDAPTVRIHIGRVDVRAIAPAAAPHAPARDTRRGIITLDEYVQQRGGAKS